MRGFVLEFFFLSASHSESGGIAQFVIAPNGDRKVSSSLPTLDISSFCRLRKERKLATARVSTLGS